MTREQIKKYEADGVLTERQAEILTLRLRFSQYTVGLALGISRDTVKSLERRAYDKIAGVRMDAA